ncbi:uncharacterized protein TNCV_2433701 [Trichonephila clavipes]|nr:uncharacterized protein TNCV_2433701 [Trichonephila clavipes]
MFCKGTYKTWIKSDTVLFDLSFTTETEIQHIPRERRCKDAALLVKASKPLGDGQEKPYSLIMDEIYANIQLSNKLGMPFLKIDTNSERGMAFQKELRSRISGYSNKYKQLTNRPSSQKLISYFRMPKNKSIEIASSKDESDFELIHHKRR